MTDRVLFYCQHVLGIGHLVRSAEIVRQLARDSRVLLISGGEKPEGFEFPEHRDVEILQLPALKTDPDFSNLHACGSSQSLDEIKTLRQTTLLQAFATFKPDAIVTELFPFGRKQFRFELLPLLEQARQEPRHTLVVSSVRDILVKRKDQAEFEQRVCDLVNAFYDLVLVHGDENFQKLDETFSRLGELHCPVVHTGYVTRKSQSESGDACRSPQVERREPMIVVSNGGGQYLTGQMLLESILLAAKLLRSRIPHEFCVFAGPLMPEAAYHRLRSIAHGCDKVRLARFTTDLMAILKRAELSVSMAGYNTMMDVLASGIRAMVYPVTSNDDQEQIMRADSLARTGVLDVIRTEDLAPENLAVKLECALGKKPVMLSLNFDGAANTARILKRLLAAHREHPLDPPQPKRWSQEEASAHAHVSDSGTVERQQIGGSDAADGLFARHIRSRQYPANAGNLQARESCHQGFVDPDHQRFAHVTKFPR